MDLDSPPSPQHVTELSSPDSGAPASAVAPQIPSPRSGRHPVFKGIRCRSGKWVSEIREPRKTTRIWLGTYATAEMAAAAYDVATLALKGPEPALNFPHLATCYPVPASQGAGDIRAAAAAASGLIKCDTGGSVEVQIEFPPADEGTNHFPEPLSVKSSDTGDTTESPLSGHETEGLSNPNSPHPPPPPSALEKDIPAFLLPDATGDAFSPGEEFVDEEELFEMPKLLAEMAEGMLVSPPRLKSASYEMEEQEEVSANFSGDDNLWSYSILQGGHD